MNSTTRVRFHQEIRNIPISKIDPNEFNSNEVSEFEQQKIKEDIISNGFIGAILVRPKNDERYEIVDGEHRYLALKEIGIKEVPCIIVPQDNKRAMLNSVRLNTERGTQNPKKLAKIVKSLQDDGLSLSEVSHELVYNEYELEDKLDLLHLPENIDELIRQREELEREQMHYIFSFMVPASLKAEVDKAVEMMGEHKGKALGEICKKIIQEFENGRDDGKEEHYREKA